MIDQMKKDFPSSANCVLRRPSTREYSFWC